MDPQDPEPVPEALPAEGAQALRAIATTFLREFIEYKRIEAPSAMCHICLQLVGEATVEIPTERIHRKAYRQLRRQQNAPLGKSVRRFYLLENCKCFLVMCVPCGRNIRRGNTPNHRLCPGCRADCPTALPSPIPAFGTDRDYYFQLIQITRSFKTCRFLTRQKHKKPCPAGRMCDFSHLGPDGIAQQLHPPIWEQLKPDRLPPKDEADVIVID